jgi:hypothetical protein
MAPETRGCFIAIAFKLCFRIRHWNGPRKPGSTEIVGAHRLLFYGDDINLFEDNMNTVKFY